MTETIDQTNLAEIVGQLRSDSLAMKGLLNSFSRVTVRANRANPFLGQPVKLSARVTHALEQQPRSGVRVTLTTTEGCLRTTQGFRQREGKALDLRTDGNGEVRVNLLPESGELWHEDMITGLQAVLLPLAESEAAPVEAGQTLVQAYRWQPNQHFRQATDRLYALNRARLEHAAGQVSDSWPLLGVAVSVFVHDDDGAVTGSSLYAFSYKDWLLPLVGTYLAGGQLSERLRGQLRDANRLAPDSSQATAAFQNQVRTFVGAQRGALGKFAGGLAASKALNLFLKQDLNEETPEVRKVLDTGLRATSGALAGGGAEILAGIGDLRGEIREQLSREIGSIDLSKVKGLQNSLQEVRGSITAVHNDLKQDVGDLQGTLLNKADLEPFNALKNRTESALTETLSREEFQGFQTSNTQRLDSLVTQTEFTTFQSKTETGLKNAHTRKEFQTFQTANTKAIGGLVPKKEFTNFRDQDFAKFKQTTQTEFSSRKATTAEFRQATNASIAARLETKAFIALRGVLVKNLEKLEVRGFELEGMGILKPNKNSELAPYIKELDLGTIDLGPVTRGGGTILTGGGTVFTGGGFLTGPVVPGGGIFTGPVITGGGITTPVPNLEEEPEDKDD